MERIVTNKNVSYNREVMRVFAKASWNYPVHAIISLLTPLSAVLMNVGVPYFAGAHWQVF